MTFAEGLMVQYKDYIGSVRFICESYITICISQSPEDKQRDVCVLVYRNQFDTVKLLKESSK